MGILLFVVKRLNPVSETTSPLIPFTSDFRFEPPPDEINLSNNDECLGEKKCKVSDPFSCVTCKNLLSSCEHLDQDTTVISSSGEKSILKKNQDPDEGYCLAVKKITEICSPQGDLCLVSPSPDTFNFTLMCVCKNPGLIGNNELFGDCTDVRICNGKIDDINKPIEQIKCICPENQESTHTPDGIPVCQELKVLNDKGALQSYFNSNFQNLISTDFFDKNIQQNLPYVSSLPDPCSRCLVTGQTVPAKTIKFQSQDKTFTFCTETAPSNEFVIVNKNDINGQTISVDKGGDAVLALTWRAFVILFGQNQNYLPFYQCYKEDQKTSAFDNLFQNFKYIYIEAGGAILGANIMSAFSFEDRTAVRFDSNTFGWNAYVADFNEISDRWVKHVVTNKYTYNKSLDGCPWAFGVGCGDWDAIQKLRFSRLASTENLLFFYEGDLIGNSKIVENANVIGLAGIYDNGSLIFKPMILNDNSQAQFIKNRQMFQGISNPFSVAVFFKDLV